MASVVCGRLRHMMLWSLADVERAIRASWGADTCAPEDIPDWHRGNPARGQCGTTALVLNDLLGGDLVRGDVHRDGEWADYHWWNRLGDGVELDLTREQFASHELVGPGEPVPRPTGHTRLDTEYGILRERVLTHLRR
ncbi:hypothetical protein GCM10023222_05570 [Saccharopolyspora cebuensis]|uniref:Uncharacterized protein n=2 Tax=Saccharopolyspora cebuensis TaxID=418759 RepID=A0ABV4CMH5_9PSEU